MQLDSKEERSKTFDLHEAKFPIKVKCPAKLYELNSWSDVSDMLLNPIGGVSLIEHARTLCVKDGKAWKTISLESLSFIPEVAMYLIDYSRATSAHIKGYLFAGDLKDQPHIYYGLGQAFDIIAAARNECELDNVRTARKQAKQNG